MKFALVISSFVAAAFGQAVINTPESVLACANHQVTFSGGVAPYTILVVPGGSPSAAALDTFSAVQCSPFTWFVTEAAGTSVFLRLQDSAGASVSTAPFTIQPSASGNATCTPPATTSQAACSAGSTVTGAAGGGATTSAAAGGGATTTPTAAGGSGSTSTPAAGGGSSSGHSTTSSSASTTHTGAAVSNQVGIAGAIAGFVAMGLAALA